MLYILHYKNLGCSRHRQMGHCKTLPQNILRLQKLCSLPSKLLFLDQTKLERFVEQRLLSSDKEEEERWREEGAKQNFRVLFERIIRLHLPAFIPVINWSFVINNVQLFCQCPSIWYPVRSIEWHMAIFEVVCNFLLRNWRNWQFIFFWKSIFIKLSNDI